MFEYIAYSRLKETLERRVLILFRPFFSSKECNFVQSHAPKRG